MKTRKLPNGIYIREAENEFTILTSENTLQISRCGSYVYLWSDYHFEVCSGNADYFLIVRGKEIFNGLSIIADRVYLHEFKALKADEERNSYVFELLMQGGLYTVGFLTDQAFSRGLKAGRAEIRSGLRALIDG